MGQITKTTHIEICVEVEADYTPGSPAVMPCPSNETGTPPDAEELEITSVKVMTPGDNATTDILATLSPTQIEQLEERIKDDFDADEDY